MIAELPTLLLTVIKGGKGVGFFLFDSKKKFTELASSSVSVYVDGERCCCASPKSVQLPEHTSFRINQIGSQNTHTQNQDFF